MSFLTRLSLANRGLVALIAIVITGFGLFAIPSLKQQLFPSIELPAAFVGAALPGAGPEIIQDQITKPIEDAVKGVDSVDSVTSTTREGSASITVAFVYGTDIDAAVNQLTTSVNRIQSQLPEEAGACTSATAYAAAAYAVAEALAVLDGAPPLLLGESVDILGPHELRRRRWERHSGCGCPP